MAAALQVSTLIASDLSQAVAFAQRCFDHWHKSGLVREGPYQALRTSYLALQSNLETGKPILDDMQLLLRECLLELQATARGGRQGLRRVRSAGAYTGYAINSAISSSYASRSRN